MEASKAAAERDGRSTAVLTLLSEAEVVSLRAPSALPPTPYAIEMAHACGGTLVSDGGTLVFTMPTLLALRQRERATRDAQRV